MWKSGGFSSSLQYRCHKAIVYWKAYVPWSLLPDQILPHLSKFLTIFIDSKIEAVDNQMCKISLQQELILLFSGHLFSKTNASCFLELGILHKKSTISMSRQSGRKYPTILQSFILTTTYKILYLLPIVVRNVVKLSKSIQISEILRFCVFVYAKG